MKLFLYLKIIPYIWMQMTTKCIFANNNADYMTAWIYKKTFSQTLPCVSVCLGILLWTDCRELRELQMLSALSAPLASPLYSANWPEVKNSLGWLGRDWFTDFMHKVNTLSGGDLSFLHHILASYFPLDVLWGFIPALFNPTGCVCLTGRLGWINKPFHVCSEKSLVAQKTKDNINILIIDSGEKTMSHLF